MKYIAIISDKFCQTKIFLPDLKTFTPATYQTDTTAFSSRAYAHHFRFYIVYKSAKKESLF